MVSVDEFIVKFIYRFMVSVYGFMLLVLFSMYTYSEFFSILRGLSEDWKKFGSISACHVHIENKIGSIDATDKNKTIQKIKNKNYT